MNWILFGFKNCGKTTLGKAVAKELNRSFIDTDRLLEALYQERTGDSKTFREIYNAVGEEGFRRLELDVLEQLKTLQNAIIALGGGMILNPALAAKLAKFGQLVYFRVNKEILKKRTLSRELPAYLDSKNSSESFEKMHTERLPKYEEILALSIDLENKTQAESVSQICALIQTKEHEHGK